MPELDRPTLIVFGGLSASGKSRTAKEVATRTGVPVYDTDDKRKELHPDWPHISPATAHLPYDLAEDLALRAAHREAQLKAGQALDEGTSPILVQTLRTPLSHAIIESLAVKHKAGLFVVRFHAPLEVLLSRVQGRDPKKEFVHQEAQLLRQFNGHTPYPNPGLFIDTSSCSPRQTADTVLLEIRKILT